MGGWICLEWWIEEDERIDDLQCKGLKIIQKTDGFCFGMDAVLLADFACVKKGEHVIDLGTGTGIIPILLAGKTEAATITGLEIQKHMAEMADRSIKLNRLQDRVKIIPGDLREAVEIFGASRFHVATVNPPYMNRGGGKVNPSDAKAVARHEILCTLEDILRVSSRLLIPGGRLCMVHKPERLVDVLCGMRNFGIEPKAIRFVHPSPGKKAVLLLVQAARNGNPQLKMMEPLYIRGEDGNYTDEINRIYNY